MNQGIEITQVANGFVLTIPYQIPQVPVLGDEYFERMESMARKIKGVDPVMDKIEEEKIIEQKQKEKEADTILSSVLSIPVMQNIYIFPTFQEVLEFLKDKFN